MASDDERFQRVNLRFPREIHAKLAWAADEHGCSINSEVVDRLEQTFLDPDLSSQAASDARALSYAIIAKNLCEAILEKSNVFGPDYTAFVADIYKRLDLETVQLSRDVIETTTSMIDGAIADKAAGQSARVVQGNPRARR